MGKSVDTKRTWSITDKSSYICGSINFKDFTSSDSFDLCHKFRRFCESYKMILNYYFIPHDETDTFHIHYAFYCKSSVMLLTMLNKISKFMDLENQAVNIQPCSYLGAYLKYMLHQDKESILLEKKRYEISDIISNDSIDVLDCLINSEKGGINAVYLASIVVNCHDDFELMVRLGLPIYHKYRYEIQKIQESRSFVKSHLEELDNLRSSDNVDNPLPF